MKKASRIILTSIPILGSVGGVGGYMVYQFKQQDKPANRTFQDRSGHVSPDEVSGGAHDQQTNLLSHFKIFPQINAHMFYKYIKMSNGKAYMDDIFIAQVVNKVLKEIQISDGHIEWDYSINDAKDDLVVTFKWYSEGQGRVFTKSYRLNISKSV